MINNLLEGFDIDAPWLYGYDKRQDCQLRQPCLDYYLLLKANHLTP